MSAPEKGILYSDTAAEPAAYFALFETTGWNEIYRRTEEELARTLRNSWHLVTATHDGELVGAGRLVSDGIQYAVVFDMIVAPEWQGRGIGSEILRRLLARCDEAGIRDVLLFAARGTESFYRSHGFAPRPEDAPGMIMRRSKEQLS
jgi:N-acetylglutamate synthase-like GNAT family acetyltransferase